MNWFWDWKVTHEGIYYARFGPYLGEAEKLSISIEKIKPFLFQSLRPIHTLKQFSSSTNQCHEFPNKKDIIAVFFFRIAVHFVRCAILGTFGISTFIGSSSTLAATPQLCGSRPMWWCGGAYEWNSWASLGDVSLSTSLNCNLKPKCTSSQHSLLRPQRGAGESNLVFSRSSSKMP